MIIPHSCFFGNGLIMSKYIKIRIYFFISLIVLVFPMSVSSQTTTRTIHQGPIYNSETDTYYELRNDNYDRRRGGGGYKNFSWMSASKRARTKFYKGRRGRLAIVRDQQTLGFIRNNFDVREQSFIGLRFFCKFRKLLWVTGEIQPMHKSFWAPRWHRTKIRCLANPRMKYMGVYLTPKSEGVLWQAAGIGKGYFGYFVEYPPK